MTDREFQAFPHCVYDICLTEVSSYFSSKIGALECFEEIFELKELDEVCFGLIFADFLNAEVDLKYVNEPSCEARFLDTAFLEADLSKSEKKIREFERNAIYLGNTVYVDFSGISEWQKNPEIYTLYWDCIIFVWILPSSMYPVSTSTL